jgi:hypothetical protein
MTSINATNGRRGQEEFDHFTRNGKVTRVARVDAEDGIIRVYAWADDGDYDAPTGGDGYSDLACPFPDLRDILGRTQED